jgi:uncharacterized SAM-binding protein YcdF (DUF218 family)
VRFRRRQLLIPAALLVILVVSRESWLPWFGVYLVKTDQLQKADALLVLAGDATGNRIRTAADLALSGLAPIVIVSGPDEQYGFNEADLAIGYAVKRGYPESLFRPFRRKADSTREEAQNFLRDAEMSKIRSLIVVTSDFHTRRAGRVFRSILKNVTIYVAAAPTRKFQPLTWWQQRPSQKVAVEEWAKTFADWLGI